MSKKTMVKESSNNSGGLSVQSFCGFFDKLWSKNAEHLGPEKKTVVSSTIFEEIHQLVGWFQPIWKILVKLDHFPR